MITLNGKYNSCKIYTDRITPGTEGQLTALLNQESASGSVIRIMPDCHEGAGRLMSRSEAKQSFTVSEFKKQMEGIYSTTVSRETLDESPMAYKSMAEIVTNIRDTAAIDSIIRPVFNFKAAGE